jgi:hypothetical protein
VGDQLFECPVILQSRQVRILRARTTPPEDCGGPEAFLALREEHGLFDTTMRMAELTGLLLAASPTSTVREVLGEAIEELPGLL